MGGVRRHAGCPQPDPDALPSRAAPPRPAQNELMAVAAANRARLVPALAGVLGELDARQAEAALQAKEEEDVQAWILKMRELHRQQHRQRREQAHAEALAAKKQTIMASPRPGEYPWGLIGGPGGSGAPAARLACRASPLSPPCTPARPAPQCWGGSAGRTTSLAAATAAARGARGRPRCSTRCALTSSTTCWRSGRPTRRLFALCAATATQRRPTKLSSASAATWRCTSSATASPPCPTASGCASRAASTRRCCASRACPRCAAAGRSRGSSPPMRACARPGMLHGAHSPHPHKMLLPPRPAAFPAARHPAARLGHQPRPQAAGGRRAVVPLRAVPHQVRRLQARRRRPALGALGALLRGGRRRSLCVPFGLAECRSSRRPSRPLRPALPPRRPARCGRPRRSCRTVRCRGRGAASLWLAWRRSRATGVRDRGRLRGRGGAMHGCRGRMRWACQWECVPSPQSPALAAATQAGGALCHLRPDRRRGDGVPAAGRLPQRLPRAVRPQHWPLPQ